MQLRRRSAQNARRVIGEQVGELRQASHGAEGPALSIVVAVHDDRANLDATLSALRASCFSAEVFFSVAGEAPRSLTGLPSGWRVLQAEAEALTPHLWRNGILAARSDRVALTSAEFALPSGWVAAASRVDLDRWVGVGGHIGPAVKGGLGWAVYLLRYRGFAPSGGEHDAKEIPADNAVYRRSAILAHPDLLELGFWEPSFHRRFHAAGLRLGMDPALRSDYVGQERGATFCRRRFQHGRAFGLARGSHLPRSILTAYLLASPLLPFLLLARIGTWSFRRPRYPRAFVIALPWLVAFCVAWSLGEGFGYLDSLLGSRRLDAAAEGRSTDIIAENRDVGTP